MLELNCVLIELEENEIKCLEEYFKSKEIKICKINIPIENLKDILVSNNECIIQIFRKHLTVYNILALNEYITLSNNEDLKSEVKEWINNNTSIILKAENVKCVSMKTINEIIELSNITIHSEYKLLTHYLKIIENCNIKYTSLIKLNNFQWNKVESEIKQYSLKEIIYPSIITPEMIETAKENQINHNRSYTILPPSPIKSINEIIFDIDINDNIWNLDISKLSIKDTRIVSSQFYYITNINDLNLTIRSEQIPYFIDYIKDQSFEGFMRLKVNNVDVADNRFFELFELFKTFSFIENIFISVSPHSLKDISKTISFYELLFSITRKKHIFIELPQTTGVEKLDLFLHSANRKDTEIKITEDMMMNEEQFAVFLQSLYSFPYITKFEISSILNAILYLYLDNKLNDSMLYSLMLVITNLYNDLSSLILTNDNLSSEGLVIISESLPSIPMIKTLILNHNNINDKGSAILSKMIPYVIYVDIIDLSFNKIDHSTSENICTIIEKTKSLKTFLLNDNNLGTRSCIDIVKVMEKSCIKFLDIRNNGCTDELKESCGSIFEKFPDIKY